MKCQKCIPLELPSAVRCMGRAVSAQAGLRRAEKLEEDEKN